MKKTASTTPTALVPATHFTGNAPATPAADTKRHNAVIAIERIDLNPRQHRKQTDPAMIGELAQNIARNGLIHPITVREANGRYELICGERRLKAVTQLGCTVIDAIVRNVDDDAAYHLSVCENIHREEIHPMDCAEAYKYLITKMNMSVDAIALQYRVSRESIHKTLKLCDLIPEIAALVRSGKLSAGSGIAVAKHDKARQALVYKERFREDGRGEWCDLVPAALERKIKEAYTSQLDKYAFDKTQCAKCPHNSRNFDLFANENECERCENPACLNKKRSEWTLEQGRNLTKADPHVSLVRNHYSSENEIEKKLKAEGHDFKVMNLYDLRDYPCKPTAPEQSSYKSAEDYAKAVGRYEADSKQYRDKIKDLETKKEQGKIKVYAQVDTDGIRYHYKEVSDKAAKPEKTTAKLIAELTEKKKRNNELAQEKTVADIRNLLMESAIPASEFTALEENMLYYFMLGTLRRSNYKTFGIKGCYLDDKNKVAIVAKLTPEQKTVIRRDYIYDFVRNALPHSIDGKMLTDFSKLHFPEKTAVIHADHKAAYDKRNARLDERIEELKAREKVAAKMEKPKADKPAAPAKKSKPATQPQAAQ